MLLIDVLGLSAAFCTTISFVPQAIKVVKTGDTEALSLLMYTIFTLGVALWLAYGLMRQDLAISLANIVTIILASIILVMKVRNELRKRVK
jgi:MtN3 and saliva related transmembrane protein